MNDYKQKLEETILHLKFLDKLISHDTYAPFVPAISNVINLIDSNIQMFLSTFPQSEIIKIVEHDSCECERCKEYNKYSKWVDEVKELL